MPTYTWQCQNCGGEIEQFMTIREYTCSPPAFICCGQAMPRRLLPTMLMHTNDASYANLKASDGTDISSRAKHRAYMKAHGYTTIDDYKETWKRDAADRAARMRGEDPSRKQDIANAITQLESQGGRRLSPERFADPE